MVADRGADIYEHLQHCQAQGLGFVVRAAQNRALVAWADKTSASTSRPGPSQAPVPKPGATLNCWPVPSGRPKMRPRR